MDRASAYLEEAASILGEVPAVRVNRAVSLYLKELEKRPGEGLDQALAVLESRPDEDPEGLMANCAGNLLVRARRFDEADPWYRRALAAAPANIQYRYNRASCLIELARYGEADDVLTAGLGDFSPESSPDMLELIAFVAVKKGEYKRAEAASRAALGIDPDHVPSLLQLGWSAAFAGRWDNVAAALDHLDELELSEDTARGRDDLEAWMEEALHKTVACASCGREWKVERNPPIQAKLRLYAAPPDDMPAGICPGCGKTYCVGCRRDAVDESGRFICPDCGKTLKLTDDSLRALLNDWAEKNIGGKKRKKKSPPKTPEGDTPETPPATEPAAVATERSRRRSGVATAAERACSSPRSPSRRSQRFPRRHQIRRLAHLPEAALRFRQRIRQPPRRLIRRQVPSVHPLQASAHVPEWILDQIRRQQTDMQSRRNLQTMQRQQLVAALPADSPKPPGCARRRIAPAPPTPHVPPSVPGRAEDDRKADPAPSSPCGGGNAGRCVPCGARQRRTTVFGQ